MLHTSRPSPGDATRTPWIPSGSRSTAMTSGLDSICVVAASNAVTSVPMTSGAAMMANMPNWARPSSNVRPWPGSG
ncbi:hypothetical protein MPTA5024_06225 [Microbispora sp. ATCC PTA-5024]|nr:hypothetical protein MPTA5024_06225 [Microbispora sp. ATCC PTA-5024]